MKYGVIVYHDTENIGDDIQSFAASQLLPQVDYYIEREHLDVFRPAEDEPVNVIMNGWFMHNKLGWPVSNCINPLYLSMHFAENDPLDIRDLFLQGLGARDLKEHAPIGCRDLETRDLLERNGIETWFSGCVTLTLNPIGPKEVRPYVCLTNVSQEVADYVRATYPDLECRIISQDEPDLIDPAASWPERMDNVRRLLQVYQNATAVVTTRLHCAMPCLALQTPVLLLSEEDIEEKGRFDGLGTLPHHASTADYLAGKVDFDLQAPPANPADYLTLRQGILDKVQQFLQANRVCTPELKARFARYDSEWEQRSLWRDELVFALQKRAVEKWRKDQTWLNELTAARDWFQDLYKKQLAESQALTDEKQQQKARLQSELDRARQLAEANKTLAEETRMLQDRLQNKDEQIRQLRREIAALAQQIWKLRHPVRAMANKLTKRK